MMCCPLLKSLVFAGAMLSLAATSWNDEMNCENTRSLPNSWQNDLAWSSPTTQDVSPLAISTANVAEGWGTIKGQVIYGGASIPTMPALNVTSDQAHCLAKGPLQDQTWVVDQSSKGVSNVVAFVLPERGEKLPVHASLKATPSEFVLDQPHCVFTPHVFAVRAGQTIRAKNPDPVSHNVVVKGLRNDINVQVAPGTDKTLTLQPESNAMAISCGSHPWMRGYGWCFDHPYFAVTDKDGKFEIKNIPAGARKLIIWHEKDGYLPGFSKKSGEQKVVTITEGAVVDLGQIKVIPK